MVEGFVDLLQERGKAGGIGARHPAKRGKEASADTGFGHARFEPLNRGFVQAGDGTQEQAHRVGAPQRPDRRGGESRVVEWTVNGLNMEIHHDPKVCHGCGRVNASRTFRLDRAGAECWRLFAARAKQELFRSSTADVSEGWNWLGALCNGKRGATSTDRRSHRLAYSAPPLQEFTGADADLVQWFEIEVVNGPSGTPRVFRFVPTFERQNVILEIGYFTERLGRKRVCALVQEGVETPSDHDGVVYVDFDNAGARKMKVGQELNATGFNVDANRAL